MRLGAHGGNRFTIVLRDVSCDAAELEAALTALEATGFINYFGLQRFGASDEAATHKLGIALLRSDFAGVLEMILSVGREGEKAEEAAAREMWRATRDAAAVLKQVPRRMHIERQLLEGVVRHGLTNPLGALSRLPKSLRSMYLHAFQSFVFNHAASERVRIYGCEKAVEGDLVSSGAWSSAAEAADVDESGEGEGGSGLVSGDHVEAAALSESAAISEGSEGADERLSAEHAPHVVTAAEEAAGRYTIDDVVLPLPGNRVQLPTNRVRDAYERIMAQHGLDAAMVALSPPPQATRRESSWQPP